MKKKNKIVNQHEKENALLTNNDYVFVYSIVGQTHFVIDILHFYYNLCVCVLIFDRVNAWSTSRKQRRCDGTLIFFFFSLLRSILHAQTNGVNSNFQEENLRISR